MTEKYFISKIEFYRSLIVSVLNSHYLSDDDRLNIFLYFMNKHSSIVNEYEERLAFFSPYDSCLADPDPEDLSVLDEVFIQPYFPLHD